MKACAPGFLSAVVIAIVVGVGSSVATAWMLAPRERPAPAVESVPAWASAVEAAVRRLESATAGIETRRTPGETVRDPLDETADVGSAAREILTLLRELREMRALGSGSVAQQPIPRGVPQDWAELSRLHWLGETDAQAAADAVTLMVPAEVVARFGQPSRVSRENGELRLTYHQVDAAGELVGHVAFVMEDGFVVRLESFLPR